MRKDHMIVIFFLALAVIIPILASADSYTVTTSSDKFLGAFLVNQSGFTLYYTKNDSTVNEASTCYGECAAKWMPFYAPN